MCNYNIIVSFPHLVRNFILFFFSVLLLSADIKLKYREKISKNIYFGKAYNMFNVHFLFLNYIGLL